MELNKDNHEDEDNKDKLEEIDKLINEQSNDLKNLNDILILSLSDKNQLPSFFKDLRQKIFHSLYENHSFKDNQDIIAEIITNLEQYLLNHSNDIDPIYIETLEFLMMQFLFHFDIHLNKLGFELIKFLIDILNVSYCNELIEYFIKIIQLLNIKKQINNKNTSFISSMIIYNISLGIYIIMSNKQILRENKKSFFDFIKRNINDVNLLYLLFIPCDNNLIKYSNILNNDEIKFIYEKVSEMLNRTYTDLTNNLPKKKTDVSYIKEKVNKIGLLCKILNSVTIEGNKTYILDKLIKNMIPVCQRISDTFNYFIELQNSDLKICGETMENIFAYFKTIGVFSIDNILKAISFVNKMYNDYSHDYLSIIIYLIHELSKLSLSCEENRIKNIILLIIQIIEIVLQKNKSKNNNKLCLDIYELSKINQIYNIILKIDSKALIPKNKFPNTYDFFVEKKSINDFENIEKDFNKKNFNYLSQIYLNSIAAGNSQNNIINKKSFLNCLNKFEDFKNSFKESLSLQKELMIEKNIEKEKKEIEKKENITFDDFQNFFLKNSMEMFNEIYSKE